MRSILFLFLMSELSIAQVRSNLFTKSEPSKKAEAIKQPLNVKETKKNQTVKLVGNLPSYLLSRIRFNSEESPIILPTNKQGIRNYDLNSGDVVNARIEESLIAFSDSKAPIRAVITSGKLKGSILLGEASLEKNSKRILVDFKKLRSINGTQLWSVQAAGLDQTGIYGIEGKLISGEEKYFAAEFLAAGAAGYADATIKRDQNALGNYVEEPGVNTVAKKALSGAFSRTADRFSEKLKSVPEYSVLEGPFEIRVLIIDQPKLSE